MGNDTTSTRHTPGPWQAVRSIPEEGFDGWHINAHPNAAMRGFTHNLGWVNGPRVNEANAHLIAAAPDLLEALKRQAANMAFVLNNVGITGAWFDKFQRELAEDRAAIAKAEGR